MNDKRQRILDIRLLLDEAPLRQRQAGSPRARAEQLVSAARPLSTPRNILAARAEGGTDETRDS